MNAQEKTMKAVELLDSKKGRNITAIHVSEITTVTDYMVICTGSSTTQIKALADELCEKMREAGEAELRIEGMQTATWILVDFGDVIVHIFNAEMREFYDLDHFWGDGDMVDISQIIKPD